MQWSQIWGEVAANFPTANQGRAQLAAQAAYHEFMHGRQFSFRESQVVAIALSAGVNKLVLRGTAPVVPDFDGLIDVLLEITSGGDTKPLTEMQQSDFDRVFGHSKTNSEPVVYCVRGGTPAITSATVTSGGQQVIQLGPPPVATATHGVNLILNYFRSVGTVEMSANTDVPLIPEQYHYALVLGGNAYMAEAIGNMQKAAQWRQMFTQRIQEAVVADQGNRMRDRQLLAFQGGAFVYPITGQSQATLDLATRPYDQHS